ncbi:MAG: diaminopropionate ammonia-lyase [Rhodobacteraceae bacterium]|nr:diaminopropionate ammonia-lyase [Paracoccaceae bacterium]
MTFKILAARDFGEIDNEMVAGSTTSQLAQSAATAVPQIKSWPGYAPTPLVNLSGLAKSTNIAKLAIKDEATRFGLGSFKALGGAYAIARLLGEKAKAETGEHGTLEFLLSEAGQKANANLTVCCATDGNHGRSVAWGAQMFGCGCVIFIHETVSDERKRAIEFYGANVVRTAGNYDDSVREAKDQALANGWTVVSDTSYEGYRDIPLDVMAGYSVMAREAIEQWGAENPPTHVFLQTGVGAMAASIVVQLQQVYGDACPKIILCDPMKAACWFDSLKDGSPRVVTGDLDTIMAGLACGEVSQLAWDILNDCVAAVIAIDDDAAENAMRVLSAGANQDALMVAGESGVGGLAAFLAVAQDEEARATLSITNQSGLLFFSTEGATDVAVYRAIVGKSPDDVANNR